MEKPMTNLTRTLSKSVTGISSFADSKHSGDSDSDSIAAAEVKPDGQPLQPSGLSTTTSNAILSQSLALTDLIFGIYAIELWHYDDSTGKLVPVSLASRDEETGTSGSGLLLKRKTQETDMENDYASADALHAFNKLTDPSRRDYLPAKPVDPGVGLPGVLWAQSHSTLGALHLGGNVRNALHTRRASASIDQLVNEGQHDGIMWRDVGELANDPHQPYDDRLQSFAKAGFKLAAAIPFDTNGYRGIVIYFGNPHAAPEKLHHHANSKFMNNTAQLIGAAAAIQAPMEQIKAFREESAYQNWHRMKIKLLTIVRFGGCLRRNAKVEAGVMEKPQLTRKRTSIDLLRSITASFRKDARVQLSEAKEGAKSRVSRWGKKIQGGSAGIPPSASISQCLWTFLGVMITHTILSRINLLVKEESDGELSLILAPLGALTSLQYCLTAAPAAQPRNAFLAQVFALTTSILLSYIPNVDPWFRSALAPAIVIPGMARLGIIHPPAGAAAIVFSSGMVRWEHFGIFLCGVAISIITAVGINNMSDKRQYPTSWYYINKAKSHISKE